MKTLEELKSQESSWPVIEEIMSRAVNKYEILPKDEKNADEALYHLQQSVRSLMGAITYETGGILIDNGWLRILGSGSEKLTRNIANWNLGRSHETEEETPGFLMVADDALGGIFAVNGTELGDDPGAMYYLAPDTLEWEPLEVTYHEFLEFCFTGQIQDFYENFRWEGWEEEVSKLPGDQVIMITPPLWAEGPDNLGERTRVLIPVDESYNMLLELNNMLIDEDFDTEGCGCDDEECGCEDDDCECGGHEEGSCGCDNDK